MSKFSNINWAALITGGAWGTYNGFKSWGIWWAVGFLIVNAIPFLGEAAIFLIAPVALMVYVLLAAMSVYLALWGNHMLSEKIRNRRLSPEQEHEARMTTLARQINIAVYGIFLKLVTIFLFAWVPMWRISTWEGQFDSGIFFQIVFAMIIIDILALVVTLILAFVRGDKENELYSSDRIPADLIAATPMSVQSKRSGELDKQRHGIQSDAEYERKLQVQRKRAVKRRETALRKSRQLDQREYIKGNVQAAFDLEDNK